MWFSKANGLIPAAHLYCSPLGQVGEVVVVMGSGGILGKISLKHACDKLTPLGLSQDCVCGLVRQISALSHYHKSAQAFAPGLEGTRDHFRSQTGSFSPGWLGSGSESASHPAPGRLQAPARGAQV